MFSADPLYEMKTIKVIVLINALLYVIFLCGSGWALTKIITAPKFQSMPSYPIFVFISFWFIGHIFPVLCIIGLALRKNWGRILTIVLNIIMVLGLGGKLFLNVSALKSIVFPLSPSPYSQHYLFSIIYLILFASLTILLSRPQTKQFFKK